MKKHRWHLLTMLALCLALSPTRAQGAESVSYVEYSWDSISSTLNSEEKTVSEYTLVTSETTAWADNGWYVVQGEVTIPGQITVSGHANLLLTDGCSLNAQQGLNVCDQNALTIYAQSQGTGSLTTTGAGSQAGIGSTYWGYGCGTVTIHGGVIYARGGYSAAGSAGIGGGGSNGDREADFGNGGIVTIYNGTVTAIGCNGAAGIGGSSKSKTYTKGGNGGTTTIYGGRVTAVGDIYAAGIGGGGREATYVNYGKGGGDGGTTTIHGGIVIANGGERAAAIGGGLGKANNGLPTISGGMVFLNGSGTLYSDHYILPADLTIPDNSTLTLNRDQSMDIPAGVKLTVDGTLSNRGSFCNDGSLLVKGRLENGGTLENSGLLSLADRERLTGEGSLSGEGTFRLEAPLQSDLTVPSDLTYTGQVLPVVPELLNRTCTLQSTTFTLQKADQWVSDLSPQSVQDAGSYTISWSCPAATTAPIVSRSFTVRPLDISHLPLLPVYAESVSYTGQEQEHNLIGAKVGLSDLALTYTVSGGDTSATAAGIYMLTITGTGNFTGEAPLKWEIQKASQTILAPDILDACYGQTDRKVNAQGFGTLSFAVEPQSEVLSVEPDTGLLTFHRSGHATVTVTAAGDNDHFEGSTTVEVEVARAHILLRPVDMTLYIGDPAPDFSAPQMGKDYVVEGLLGDDTLAEPPQVKLFVVSPPTMTEEDTMSIHMALLDVPDDPRYTIGLSLGQLSIIPRPSRPSTGGSISSNAIRPPKDTSGGTVSVSDSKAQPGKTVTITVEPQQGQYLDRLTVTDSKGHLLTLTDLGDGRFSFEMPDGQVDIAAEFLPDTPVEERFTDVTADAYYADAVGWAVRKGITDGVGPEQFSPDNTCTRAHIITFLWRAAGSPEPTQDGSFADVAPGSYYEKAVAWAVAEGITGGVTADSFAPDSPCVRAQAMTFLYRAAGSIAATDRSSFSDVSNEAYYADAVAWAVEQGVTQGMGNDLFAPDLNCTRAQAMTFLYRLLGK